MYLCCIFNNSECRKLAFLGVLPKILVSQHKVTGTESYVKLTVYECGIVWP